MPATTLPRPTEFVNALTDAAPAAFAFGALLINRSTGHEICIDILTESDRFTAVNAAIRLTYPASRWGICETWPIAETNETEPYRGSGR